MSSDFLDVYQEQVWRVYGYLAYRLRSRVDAEDLTQLTFERAFRAWDQFDRRKGSAGSWLIAIARNVLTDHRRRAGARVRSDRTLEDVSEADLASLTGPEHYLGLEPDIAAALESLSRRERSVIALRFGGDLRGPEIAELLDLSVDNVQQILSRALRKLRSLLEADAKNPDPNEAVRDPDVASRPE